MQYLAAAFLAFVIASVVVHSSAWPVIVGLFHVALWAIPAAVCGHILYENYEPIARWYYFTFHPHPAEPAIRAALASGTVLDGKALTEVLGEAPTGTGVFRAVRAAQAESLINEMQAMTRQQMEELRARAREKHEQAAVQQMQAALAEAAIALERAKAYLHASKRS